VSVLDALPHLESELDSRIVSRRRKAGEEPQAYSPAHTITQVTHIVEHKLEALGANQKRYQDRSITEPSKTICGSGNQVGARIFEHTTNVSGAGPSVSRRALSGDRSINKPMKTLCNNTPTLRTVMPIQRKIGILKKNGRVLQPLWREMDEPINTITSLIPTVGSLPVETTREEPVKAVKIRSLTLAETAVLQGFNVDMKLPYRLKKDAWTILGNAVCPPVAEAIIRGIV